MSGTVKDLSHESQPANEVSHTSASPTSLRHQRRDSVRWWVKLILQPTLFLLAGAALLTGLGIAQKRGWLSAGTGSGKHQHTDGNKDVRYICPMMCTPPQSEPGRCPVCAMELVPAAAGSSMTASNSIQIDPVARRLANVQTAPVRLEPFTHTIKAIGEISFDEGSLKSISAYVDGRLDRLYADFTGVEVRKGDHLALLYSPKLYSSQVELLEARRTRSGSESALGDFYESARQKLLDLGMTKDQIEQVEKSGKANSRIHLCAPISGTVIEKSVVEGQYVKEGQAIYRLADLSSVWLMLRVFPEAAAVLRYGQKVAVEVPSLPGRKFQGRISYVDRTVDRKTRTVGVRVVMQNEVGELRVGDYATARIDVQLGELVHGQGEDLYDPELAGKFISPRHPHVITEEPGDCPVCGIKLVPASKLGYSDLPIRREALVIPRDAVLMAGDNSVVYVETEPGRFEIRRVTLGPGSGDQIVILHGVRKGEQVATRGNFLIDSQMQLAGNPSLIDPTRAVPGKSTTTDKKILQALAGLSPPDKALALKQRHCPVADVPLGSMGAPIKVDVKGTPVFICCEGCRGRLLKEPKKYLDKIAEQSRKAPAPEAPPPNLPPIGVPKLIVPDSESPQSRSTGKESEKAKEIVQALARLLPADRALARKQRICAVGGEPLGSMGTPVKVDVNGRPVFICCEACRAALLANPVKYLLKLSGEGGN